MAVGTHNTIKSDSMFQAPIDSSSSRLGIRLRWLIGSLALIVLVAMALLSHHQSTAAYDSTMDTNTLTPATQTPAVPNNTASTVVTVNNKAVTVPANGTYKNVTTNGGNQTTTSVHSSQTNSSSSTSVSNSSTTDVNVSSINSDEGGQ